MTNTKIADFESTVDQDEMASCELSHPYLQCLPSSLYVFNLLQFELKVFLVFF